MIMTLLAIIATLVVAWLAYAATKPDTFLIRRTTTIKATPQRIFPLIDDLHEHRSWNPFDSEPDTERTYSGPPSGKGAVFEWDGNRKAGAGRIEIVESTPSSTICLSLDMLKPFKAHNKVEFILEPHGKSTNVTWSMQGRLPFVGKLVSTLFNCDRIVGGQFEKGLAKLEALAEASAIDTKTRSR